MTTAASLRADARYVLIEQAQGVTITIQNPAPSSGEAIDPETGDLIAAGTGPALLTGYGRVTRFSDALAASPGLIQNGDRKILFYPDAVPGTPAPDGIIATTNADGSVDTYRVIAWTTREFGGEVIHHIVQERR